MNISKEYDNLYAEAVELFKEFNPCEIKDGRCGSYDGDFCCRGCKHLGKSGCRVKSLACKLWFCGCYWGQHPKGNNIPFEFFKRLKQLNKKANELNIAHCRKSKAESLRIRKKEIEHKAKHGWNNM